jgi:uncharacterized membrane protein YphA (DoxX/SURF4 family)
MLNGRRLAALYARLALGSAFLSAVAARFGLWDRRPHPFAQFVTYTGEILSFLPRATIPFCAVAATVFESTLGVLLFAGFRLRWTASASAVLLALSALSMAISLGSTGVLEAAPPIPVAGPVPPTRPPVIAVLAACHFLMMSMGES